VTVTDHDLHLLTGVYALDALDGTERSRFERHLARCASCQEEVRGLRETAARLANATAIAPPPGMRGRVLTAATQIRQLPPPGRAAPVFGAYRATRRRLTLGRPVAMIAVTAVAAVIVALLVLQVTTLRQLHVVQSRSQAIAAVLSAPDARIQTTSTKVGGTVTAVVSPSHQEAVVTTVGMPALPGKHVYQLWVMSKTGARSAGLLLASDQPALASGFSSADQLGITIEPAGGTSRPTTSPIVLIPARA
jgi:anti-sigma factor RsiW